MGRAAICIGLLAWATLFARCEEIKPYGELDWNDGLFQVIQKIQKINGITHIVLSTGSQHDLMAPKGLDVSRVQSIADLETLLEALISPNVVNYSQLDFAARIKIDKSCFRPYKNAQGNDDLYDVDPWWGDDLYAGPIYLEGHPFELCIKFRCEPGFAVKYPENCLHFSHYNIGIVPYAICDVELKTDTNVSDDIKNKLINVLASKYGVLSLIKMNLFKNGSSIILAKQEHGPEVDVMFGDGEGEKFIGYYFDPREDLLEYYETHLTNLVEKSGQKQPNGAAGL